MNSQTKARPEKTTGGIVRYAPDPLFIPGLIGWFRVEGKGIGALALKDIAAGAVIDRDPVVLMPAADMGPPGHEIELDNYVFRWGPEDANKKTKMVACITGGYIWMCNHSSNPNARLRQDHEHNLMELIALRPIQTGEEITIDYDIELWFDVKE